MERVFRSLKTEWIPTTGYRTAQEAQRDISHFLMHRYNWIRPHQFNGGLAPARAEEKLNVVSGIRSEEHTSELQSIMRISYAVFCLKKKKKNTQTQQKTI